MSARIREEKWINSFCSFPYIIYTYIVMIGATASRLAIRTPISEISKVKKRARFGSPSLETTENTWRNGMTPSLAIACKSRGALNYK